MLDFNNTSKKIAKVPEPLDYISRWDFTNNMNDETGLGNAVNGGISFINNRFNNPTQAGRLDGISDYANVPISTHQYTVGEVITVSMWLKYSSGANVMRPFEIGTNNTHPFLMIQTNGLSNNSIEFSYVNINGSRLTGASIDYTPTNLWTYFAFQFSGSYVFNSSGFRAWVGSDTLKEVKLNGITTSNNPNTQAGDLNIGRHGGQNIRYWDGDIDDVRIYLNNKTTFQHNAIFRANKYKY